MKLSEWLSLRHLRAGRFAAEIGVSDAHISEICRGKTLPSLVLAVRIERATDGAVTPADFLSDDKVA